MAKNLDATHIDALIDAAKIALDCAAIVEELPGGGMMLWCIDYEDEERDIEFDEETQTRVRAAISAVREQRDSR